MHPNILIWLKATTYLLSVSLFSINLSFADELPLQPEPNQLDLNQLDPNSKIIKQLISESSEKSLWKDQKWLNLLHYKADGDDYLSQVDDARYFNAIEGKTNPQQELSSSLKAFYNTDTSDPDQHAQCRFIARFNWLQSQLPDTFVNFPKVSCPQYNEWRKQVPEHKVSLIFPAYHLNSPSSMFGHTLLRIDPADEKIDSSWLSMAVNFGANIQAEDNSIMFAIKGLAGGYSGTFIVNPYYTKIKEYNRNENRDIWEYPLNLTPDETRQLVLHLWELKGINFDYYFFDENCSYRLLELLESARPSLKLSNQFGLNAIPVDTVRSIEQAGLINGIEYRPSQATSINFLIDQLNSTQKTFVYNLSRNAELVNSEQFKQYSQDEQSIILDAAYRYLRFQQNDVGRSKLNAKNSYQLLTAINESAFSSIKPDFKNYQRPEKGHLSKRLDITAGKYDDIDYAEINFRMSFHSLQDALNGFLEGAQINLASLSIRATEEKTQLQRLDVIDIFSLTPRNQFFQPLSWRVYTGLEQQLINGEEHLTGHVTGGAGVTYNPWSKGHLYGLVTARLEFNSQFTREIEPAMGISTGLLQHFSMGTSHLEVSGEEFLNHQYRHRVKFSQNITLSQNQALQLSVLRQRQNVADFTEAQLSYHYFFH